MNAKAASKSGGARVLLMLGITVLAVGGGIFAASKLFGSGAGKTDVGDLKALASVQAQLRTVDACVIEYNQWARSYHRQMHRRNVFITPCDAPGLFPRNAKVVLPEQWSHDALAFKAERSSVKDDWSILVDPEAVPFPVLVAGLEELAPIVARDAPAALAKSLADEAEGKAKYEESQRQQEEQRRQNQDSYPSR
ncbi:hypothetical protein [Corallococcus carmarthensis]|uniref:hypothetical protein n=1 Tax=Corallococcus carmarthensis TaxID=2316728 RepID=UPI00148E8A5E|nr:hypothetical protein [Corallococcus carmarthensis]NOK17493.1 hypothetical protein [Corallococcus carmarthensis]